MTRQATKREKEVEYYVNAKRGANQNGEKFRGKRTTCTIWTTRLPPNHIQAEAPSSDKVTKAELSSLGKSYLRK